MSAQVHAKPRLEITRESPRVVIRVATIRTASGATRLVRKKELTCQD
jgi:hypothetical protein